MQHQYKDKPKHLLKQKVISLSAVTLGSLEGWDDLLQKLTLVIIQEPKAPRNTTSPRVQLFPLLIHHHGAWQPIILLPNAGCQEPGGAAWTVWRQSLLAVCLGIMCIHFCSAVAPHCIKDSLRLLQHSWLNSSLKQWSLCMFTAFPPKVD